ncbi:hypothetical protein Saa2_05971 [Streptomyces acidiscabies]|nr:hypothetical protein Saa2_05971 [Streptomyces acidiscabies]
MEATSSGMGTAPAHARCSMRSVWTAPLGVPVLPDV